MASHYTAVLEINAVTDAVPSQKDAYNKTLDGTPRSVQEITKIVVRADNLDDLKDRLGKHLELIDE